MDNSSTEKPTETQSAAPAKPKRARQKRMKTALPNPETVHHVSEAEIPPATDDIASATQTSVGTPAPDEWSIDDSRSLYLIDRWGAGYFDVNEAGNLTVSPLQDRGSKISLTSIVEEAAELGLRTPLLVRFQDILHHRVKTLNEAFVKAVSETQFRGTYRGVFPIKVNQLREVVHEILDAGRPFHYGIEVGSKAEMYAALSMHTDNDSLIVCNGYKDDNYIRTALMGRKLGKRIVLVAEKLSEVRAICRLANEMGVEPHIGLRVRITTRGAGTWAASSGEDAMFGLSTAEIIAATDIMTEAGLRSAFKLVHFHIGSQIPDILIVKRAVREAARHYAKLRKMGHPIEFLDVGGGLAIDYDGSRSTFHASMNYTLEEYARDVIANIADVCDEERVPHPDVVSESGRAVVAHHSVLVVEAFGAVEKTPRTSIPAPASGEYVKDDNGGTASVAQHKLVRGLEQLRKRLSLQNLRESWHALLQIKEESQKMFELGLLDLPVKAVVENTFWEVAEDIDRLSAKLDPSEMPDDFFDLRRQLADQHICNFSVFQSLVDHWALGALFPVLPIHRLGERPTMPSTLVDITCDSDGKVSKFIDRKDVRETIPLHPIEPGSRYFLGLFLTGAYQDIMGDIHNLFGRVNEVHVFLDDDEACGYYIEDTIAGNTIAEVLAMTQYDRNDLVARLKSQVDAAIKQDKLRPTEGMRLLADYEKGLNDHTYLSLT